MMCIRIYFKICREGKIIRLALNESWIVWLLSFLMEKPVEFLKYYKAQKRELTAVVTRKLGGDFYSKLFSVKLNFGIGIVLRFLVLQKYRKYQKLLHFWKKPLKLLKKSWKKIIFILEIFHLCPELLYRPSDNLY